MRKLLITLAILIACAVVISAILIFGGPKLSLLIDRFGTIEIASARVNSIAYKGSGTGGTLLINDVSLSLNEATPNLFPSFGSTKDKQFALASAGKVFAFGPLAPAAENASDYLTTVPPVGDDASLVTRDGVAWPTFFNLNFWDDRKPSWTRHLYFQLHWRKSSGATLEMLWRYEQNVDRCTGGLVRLDINK